MRTALVATAIVFTCVLTAWSDGDDAAKARAKEAKRWDCIQRCANRQRTEGYWFIPLGHQDRDGAKHDVLKVKESAVKRYHIEAVVLEKLMGESRSPTARQRALEKWGILTHKNGCMVFNGEQKKEGGLVYFAVLAIDPSLYDWIDFALVKEEEQLAFSSEQNLFKAASAPYLN